MIGRGLPRRTVGASPPTQNMISYRLIQRAWKTAMTAQTLAHRYYQDVLGGDAFGEFIQLQRNIIFIHIQNLTACCFLYPYASSDRGDVVSTCQSHWGSFAPPDPPLRTYHQQQLIAAKIIHPSAWHLTPFSRGTPVPRGLVGR